MRSREQLVRDARMHLARRLNLSLAPPDRVTVNLTLRCNLKCTMCTTCYDAPELALADVKGIIDQTAAWGVRVFNPLGGEPFMRADIEEILAYAVGSGFYVTVTTNGTLITERRAASIAAVPSDRLHFNVSLDGRAAVHDAIRGQGMFARAIQGYQRIRDADRAAGNARRKILANCILHARNVHEFEGLLDDLADYGFDGVQILNLFRVADGAPPEAAALWFQDSHLPALTDVVERLAERAETRSGGRFRIQNSPEDLRRVPAYYSDELGPLEAPCWAGWKELYINADGQAIMCDGRLDFLAGAFGDARSHTLKELWRSPQLRKRRAVVKACETPCVQDCYLRRSSDSVGDIAADGLRLAARGWRARFARMRPGTRVFPDATLTLELSDTCPCDWEGCDTPASRWAALTAGAPERPNGDNWSALRDRGFVDFGRGFMGFEVVRSIVEDLRARGMRFGTLALSWRGDPLLHPEIEPILRYLLGRVAAGDLADRVRIGTTGLFITEGIARLSAHPAPQEWVLDLDRGEGAGLARLLAHRQSDVRVILTAQAALGVDPRRWRERFLDYPVVVGRRPESGDALWIRRRDHTNFSENAAARADLTAAAAALGVPLLPADLGAEDQPRRCLAPARSPTVSWDGKLTLCRHDPGLENKVGDVCEETFSAAFDGVARVAAEREAGVRGVPDRARCRDCAMPWSPNHL